MSREMMLRANGVDLCVETFGRHADPALLLISGGASSMDWWEDGFCERLAAERRFVIRYDMRDTGRSTTYELGPPPYTLRDLAKDAMGLLDALGVRSAHLVGVSMGGTIALWAARDYPERVDALTLMSTSPGGPSAEDLPPMDTRVQEHFANSSEPDWSDRAATIEHMLKDLRVFAGRRGIDEPRMRQLIGRIFDRSTSMAAAATNHALIKSGGSIRRRLKELRVATLVIHGTDDPLFPYGHAEAMAREIAGAQLLPLEGMGHEVPPPPFWDVVVRAIVTQTAQR